MLKYLPILTDLFSQFSDTGDANLPFPGGVPDPTAAALLHSLPPPPSLISGSAASGLRFPFGATGGAGSRPPLDPFSLVSMQRKLSGMGVPRAGGPLGGLPVSEPSGATEPPRLTGAGGQSSMYEMATMQNEVNTHEMVVKVKGLLAENNIAQKVRSEFQHLPFTGTPCILESRK